MDYGNGDIARGGTPVRGKRVVKAGQIIGAGTMLLSDATSFLKESNRWMNSAFLNPDGFTDMRLSGGDAAPPGGYYELGSSESGQTWIRDPYPEEKNPPRISRVNFKTSPSPRCHLARGDDVVISEGINVIDGKWVLMQRGSAYIDDPDHLKGEDYTLRGKVSATVTVIGFVPYRNAAVIARHGRRLSNTDLSY